jgi:hypothetical protein
MVSKNLSKALRETFGSLWLETDVAKFEKTFQSALGIVMNDPQIPFIAKRKFLEDVASKSKLLE